MKVNGKEVRLFYSLGADCDIDDEMQKLGVNDFAGMQERLGIVRTYAKVGAILSKWACEKDGGEAITEKEFMMLPAGALDDLGALVNAAIADGQKKEIEAKPKNAKGTAKKSK